VNLNFPKLGKFLNIWQLIVRGIWMKGRGEMALGMGMRIRMLPTGLRDARLLR